MYIADCVLSYNYLPIHLISLNAALFVNFHWYIDWFCMDYSFQVNTRLYQVNSNYLCAGLSFFVS